MRGGPSARPFQFSVNNLHHGGHGGKPLAVGHDERVSLRAGGGVREHGIPRLALAKGSASLGMTGNQLRQK